MQYIIMFMCFKLRLSKLKFFIIEGTKYLFENISVYGKYIQEVLSHLDMINTEYTLDIIWKVEFSFQIYVDYLSRPEEKDISF